MVGHGSPLRWSNPILFDLTFTATGFLVSEWGMRIVELHDA
jgi:hypothetical protein